MSNKHKHENDTRGKNINRIRQTRSLPDIEIITPSDEQPLMTQRTHLSSPSRRETKEKLPFSGFYGNSTQEHFFFFGGLFMGLLTVS